ncbi:DUF3796 domain-containing protein [Sporosarcina sp. FSL K6-2383]|uniref:DUF3796 domain-containing protein n=1 Tax=Sporosarcina sp. FSL K6-2383 TaxID=2921556 RepID=UPI00315A0597
MREDFHLLDFMLGLPLGLGIGLLVWYFVWKKGKKERRYDERYQRIQEQAKSLSWNVTVLAILIAWSIIIVFEGPGLSFFLFTALYIIAITAYGIGATIADKRN